MTQSASTFPRREYVFDGSRTYVVKKNRHSVFVIGVDGKPLTPTTEAKARKLIKGGQAVKIWSKFNTFGIKLCVITRKNVPKVTLGVDHGSKFEGRSVLCGNENVLNIKLDIPEKKYILKKLEERKLLRRERRGRLRSRKLKFNNRRMLGFISPSQLVVVLSRIKIDSEILKLYPVTDIAIEDVRFNHYKHNWGSNFSTIETGKSKIYSFYALHGFNVKKYEGYDTKTIRENLGYKKSSDKSNDNFESHCSDSLSLALDLNNKLLINPCPVICVDDRYRSVRRKLHYTQYSKGGFKRAYSCGTVFGLKKGLLIGLRNGGMGRLCGYVGLRYKFFDKYGKRNHTTKVSWISSNFKIKGSNSTSM